MHAKTGRKFVSTLAAVIGLIVFASPSALAEGAVAEVDGAQFETFEEALAAANTNANSTITLLATVNIASDAKLYVTNDMTLALGAYNLMIANNGTFTISNDVTVTRTTGGIQNLGSIEIAAGKTLDMTNFAFGAGIIDADPYATVGAFAIKAGAEVILGATMNPREMAAVNASFFSGSEAGAKFTSGSKTYVYTGSEWPVWAGAGTLADPYLISGKADLVALKTESKQNKYLTSCFKQTADIDLENLEWNCIGVKTGTQSPGDSFKADCFQGVYDGGNFTISNLKFAKMEYAALFGYLWDAAISNLTIITTGINSDAYDAEYGATVLAGFANNCTIQNVTINGEINNANHTSAGFFGKAKDTTFVDCTNNANIVTQQKRVAGFIDYDSSLHPSSLTFIRCVNNGNLRSTYKGSDDYGAGGFIAGVCGTTVLTLTDCVSNGKVELVGERDKDMLDRDGSFFGCIRPGFADHTKYLDFVISMTGCVASNANQKTVGHYLAPAANAPNSTTVTGLSFATLSDDEPAQAQLCDPALNSAQSYKVMATNVAPVVFSAVGQYIKVDETLAPLVKSQSVGTNDDDYKYTTTVDGTYTTYTLAIKDPVTVTITPTKQAPYTATVTGNAISFVNDEATIPSGAQVPVSATLTYPNYWEFTNLPAGWTQSGDTISQTFTVTADLAIEIPVPTAIQNVTVADKNGYTNFTFTIKAPAAGSYKIVAKDIETGATVGTAALEDELTAGSQTVEVAADKFTGGTGFVVGRTYTYTVQTQDGETTVGTATFSDVGWTTNGYFGASAKTGAAVYNNGAWVGEAPSIDDSKFVIDSTQQVFKIATVRQSDTRKIVTLDTEISLETYYYLDDITNDITSAIAALALVTNEEQAADASWMVLQNGDTWVKLAGTDLPVSVGDYTTRIELDYNTATPRVRYSVKPAAVDAWIVLKDGDSAEWFNAKADAAPVSNVCFIGKADVAEFAAELSTEGVAEVNGRDYPDIASALKAAGDGKVVLYTNIQVDPRTLPGGTFYFNKNDKTFTAHDISWTKADGEKTELSWDGDTLTITKKLFIAAIGDDLYFSLQSALDAAAADQTVVVLTNVAECVTSTVTSAVLDLDGFTLTKGTADKPVITVNKADASDVKLFLVGGGAITGATDVAALAVTNGAAIVVDGVFVTNNEANAILATDASTVTISNGWLTGAFATRDTAKIDIAGGYIVAAANDDISFSGEITATGGKFTNVSSNKAFTADIPATGYILTELAVAVVTNGQTISCEVMKQPIDPSSGEPIAAKVYSVTDDGETNSVGGVQIPDEWVDTHTTAAATSAEKQTELNEKINYVGTQKIKKWECYVLGIDPTSSETLKEGPVVKGVQDNKIGTIGFNILSPELIKAEQSGCDVKFEVEEYTDSSLSNPTGNTTGKIDYNKTAELSAPDSGVRYYKLKMHITPKK